MHCTSTAGARRTAQGRRDDRTDSVVDADGRIGDDDRRRTADDIAAATGAGLVDLTEAEALLGQVWSAGTRGELAAVLHRVPAEWLAARRRVEAAARERAEARRDLPGHAVRWLALVALLVAIWALTTPGGYFWPVWPALGTGWSLLGQAAPARHRVGAPA